jgi:hypothetical protein
MKYCGKKKPRKVILPGDVIDKREFRDYRASRCTVYNLRTITEEVARAMGLHALWRTLNA